LVKLVDNDGARQVSKASEAGGKSYVT
jgi:hypothetical protein